MKSELHNLWQGDYLICQGCGGIIFNLPCHSGTIYFRNIDKAYFSHMKKCFALKRLVIKQRRG